MSSKAQKRRARRTRTPSLPAEILARRAADVRAAEDRRMAGQGIDPRIARWGDEPLTPQRQAELEAQGVTVELDQRRRLKHAHRGDVFAELHARKALTAPQLAAVRRLEKDMLAHAGLEDRKAFNGVVVDAPGDACAVTQRMIDAGRRVEGVLAMVGPPSSRLLKALLDPLTAPHGRVVRHVSRPVDGDARARLDGLKRQIEHHQALGEVTPIAKLREAIASASCETESVPGWRDLVRQLTGETRAEAQSALVRQAAQSLAECYEQIDGEQTRKRSIAR